MHMLANAYADLGHDVTVVSRRCAKDPTAKYSLKSLEISGRNSILKWAVALSRYKFVADIVHFGGDDHLVGRNDDFAHIRTFHGSCFAESLVATNIRDKIRMFYLGCTELFAQKEFKVHTTVSKDTNKYFLRKNIVVPNGVDLGKFIPGNVKSSYPSILFVGTLDSRKRGRLLVEAFSSSIRANIPNAELWIVRDNSDLHIPGVKVFGAVSESRLIELYQHAWVFCLPSSYEGFGVPYIEAMACGTPVVATPNPGSLEVLDQGRYGLITDIREIGPTLASLLSDENRRRELSILGLERVQNYDIHKIANIYVELARNLTKKRVRR
jgi:phosphatidylinositol alpha-mannosyltransferase